MISIRSEREIELLRKAGQIVYDTHQYLKPLLREGISTKEIDDMAGKYIISCGAIPSCKGYQGYPANICISINDEVVHGIAGKRKLKNGDIVTLDICACYKGYHGDSAWSYAIGDVSSDAKYILEHTEKALYEGLKLAKAGNRVGDISHAIEQYAKKHHLGVIKELTGHGIGSHLHEEPNIPNYGKVGTGPMLKEGMVIAIEPMLTMGSSEIYMLDDDWTIKTDDGSLSGHFEHTVVIRNDGCEILTGE